MKKTAILLVISVLLMMCTSCTAFGKQEITLTPENFKEYFDLERVVQGHNVNHSEGGKVLGVYVPGSYSAQADIGVTVTPKVELDARDVVVEVVVYSWGFGTKWDKQEQYITLHLEKDGSASTSFSIQCEEVLLESLLPDPESGYVEAKRVEGKIYI